MDQQPDSVFIGTGRQGRSPGYPCIPIRIALDRLLEFDLRFGACGVSPGLAGEAWGMRTKATVDRMVAALRYFDLLEYRRVASCRRIFVSKLGTAYLRSDQELEKREIVKRAALRPKKIKACWKLWGGNRPEDDLCLDELCSRFEFTTAGARDFLKVYDATIGYAEPDEASLNCVRLQDIAGIADGEPADIGPELHDGRAGMSERELLAGFLGQNASFRLVVRGSIGVKELERLITKLQIDKEILAQEGLDALLRT